MREQEAAGQAAPGWRLVLLAAECWLGETQALDRATQLMRADACVPLRRVEVRVAEELLDLA
jgi:hypothetical protein